MKTQSFFKHFVVASLAVTTVLSATAAHAYDRYDRQRQAEIEAIEQQNRENVGIFTGALFGLVLGQFVGSGSGRAAATIGLPLLGAYIGGKIASQSEAKSCNDEINDNLNGDDWREIEDVQARMAELQQESKWRNTRVHAEINSKGSKIYYRSDDSRAICREVRTTFTKGKCQNIYSGYACSDRSGNWEVLQKWELRYIRDYPARERRQPRPAPVPSNPGVGYPPVYQQAGIINMVILVPGCTQAIQGCIQQVMPVACNSIPNGCQLLAGHVYYAQAAPTCTQVNQSCNQAVQIANVTPDVAASTSTAVYATAIATARDQYGNVTASAAASASATTSTPLVVAPGATVSGSGQIVLQPVSPAPAPAPAPAPVPQQSVYQVPSPAVTAKIVDMKHINAIVNQHIAGVDDCRRFQVIAWYANVFVFDWRERLSTSKAAMLLNTFSDEQWKLETLKKIRFAILVNGVDGYCVEDSTADKIVGIFKTEEGRQQALQILSVPAPTQIAKEQGYCNCPAL